MRSVDDADWQREVLALAKASLTVDVDAVVLDGQIMLQRHLGSQQVLQHVFHFTQLGSQLFHGLGDLIYLLHQTITYTVAHEFKLYIVSKQSLVLYTSVLNKPRKRSECGNYSDQLMNFDTLVVSDIWHNIRRRQMEVTVK